MAPNRLIPNSTTPGAILGDPFMDDVQDEITGLWDRSTITLTGISGTNTILATAAPALTGSLGGSMNFILKAAATNTTAVTLNINSSGAVDVVDAEGNALTAGALRANANYFLHYDSGISKFVVVNYTPRAEVSVAAKLIAYQTIAAAGSCDFVHGATLGAFTVVLDTTYDMYEIVLSKMLPATNDVEAWLRVGTGGGPTYQTAGYEYANRGGVTAAGDIFSTSAASIIMTRSSATADVSNNATAGGFNANIKFGSPSLSSVFTCRGQADWVSNSVHLGISNFAGMFNAGPITAIRFQFESGNITSGSAALYGWTKS